MTRNTPQTAPESDAEQLAWFEVPPPPTPPTARTPEAGYLDRWCKLVRVLPTWDGPLGWVLAWKVPGSHVARPDPAGYHQLGVPQFRGNWYHERFDTMDQLMGRLHATDSGDGPDWRVAKLDRVYSSVKLAKRAGVRS